MASVMVIEQSAVIGPIRHELVDVQVVGVFEHVDSTSNAHGKSIITASGGGLHAPYIGVLAQLTNAATAPALAIAARLMRIATVVARGPLVMTDAQNGQIVDVARAWR